MAMEIETLRSKKEELKCELEVEMQKEKSLEENIKILEEKLAIRDIEEKLEAKRESVEKLESIRNELELQFNQPKTQLSTEDDAKKNEQQKEQSTGLLVQEETVSNASPIESVEPSEKKKKRGFF